MATLKAATQKWLLHPAAKPVLFIACLLPFAWLFYGAFTNQLGANPAEALIRATGDWTLRFICIVLAVTPLRVVSGMPALARFRRMLGLFAKKRKTLMFNGYEAQVGQLYAGMDLKKNF